MRRRDVLQSVGVVLGGILGSAAARPAAAHPGPYEPYGWVDVEGAKEAVVSPDGSVAYLAATTGYATVDVSVPDRPAVLAEVRDPVDGHEDGPLRGIFDVKLDAADPDTLAVVGPANPLPGAVSGVLVVDVSDPAAPKRVAFHETSYPIHNCSFEDGVLYLTANDGDENALVTLDAASGERRGRWTLADADEAWAEVPSGLRPLHDVVVQDGVAYLAHWDAGTWLLDVSDPGDVSALGSVGAPDPAELTDLSRSEVRAMRVDPPGNDHYVAPDESGDLLGVGKESWARRIPDNDGDAEDDSRVVGGPSGIDLWDVSDPAAPERLSTIDPPPSPDPTYGGVWTTAHNFEFRDDRLYSSWYQGGVKRHDVSDPRSPEELTWWRDPDETKFWTARLARPGSREGFFVAASMGVNDVSGRLYTFPDHAGQQANAPTLVPPDQQTATDGSGGGTTEPLVVTATPTQTAAEESLSTGATTGTERGGGETGGASGVTEAGGVSAPGFGPTTAVGAFGYAGWRLWCRARRGANGDDRP
jgi:hypothetical protein